MDKQTAAELAIAAFFMALQAHVGLHEALVQLYEAGVEAGQKAVLDDPESYELVGRKA